MTVKRIAYRLQPEGGDQVVAEAKRVEGAMVGAQDATRAATDRAIAATERQVAKLREAAQAATSQTTAMQARINAATGVTGGTNARANMAARALYAEDDAYGRRAQELKNILDPLGAAQDRLNAELREYSTLAARGKITTEQLAQAQTLAHQRYDLATAAIDRQSRGITRLAAASRLNLSRQASDVFVTAAMGMNPAMIAIQQGPQIMDAWATSAIRLTPALVGTTAAVSALAVATGVVAYAWWDAEKSSTVYEKAVTGMGRTARLTAGELKALAEAGADQANISIKAARDQATAYVATGRISGEVIQMMIASSRDWASFTGQDLAKASETLANSMLEPSKAAREMTRTFGLLDLATLDQIDALEKAGDRMAAQKILMDAITNAASGHAEKVNEITTAWQAAGVSISDAVTKLGEWLHTTDDERLDRHARLLETISRNAPRRTWFGGYNLRDRVETGQAERDARIQAEAEAGATGATNQANLAAREREEAAKAERDRRARAAKTAADRAAREAERLAREALQRSRREEDVAARLDMEVARATNDFDTTRQLEAQERIRQRIRQLEDDGVASAQARAKAGAEELRLDNARAAARDEAGLAQQRQVDLQILRDTNDRGALRLLEDRMAHEARILAYQKAGYDLTSATAMADDERLRIAQAREQVLEREVRRAEAERRLELARLSGDEDETRWRSVQDRIQRRAGEIENRLGLKEGRGLDQAQSEIQDELDAEATGARRRWMRSLLADIKRSRLSDVVGDQLVRASDKMTDRMADQIVRLVDQIDWASLFGRGGAASNAISAGGNWLSRMIGRNSSGTDYWSGGPTWVGERGPEILDLPRGARVIEHNRSMQIARQSSAMARDAGVTVNYSPSYNVQGSGPEIEALKAQMERDRREIPEVIARTVTDMRRRSHGRAG